MTLADYTALADDGCPHCGEHVLAGNAYTVRLPSGRHIQVATVLRLEDSPSYPRDISPPSPGRPPRMPPVRSHRQRPDMRQ